MATSELTQFFEDIDEEVLGCTICYKRLQNPKSLKCLHSFCLACLESWVEEKGMLTCPTCRKSYQIPEGGLLKLSPNVILNNLLETMERYEKRNQMRCVCEKKAKYYCQDCEVYLCSSCSHHHQILPVTENHNLHSVKSMTPEEFALLHPRLCKDHKERLEFYCIPCRIPICASCTLMHHKECKGKPIKISEAFQQFKESATELKKEANDFKDDLQWGLEEVYENDKKLEQSKATSLSDIDNHVQELIEKIMKDGNKMKKNVETIYRKKKEVSKIQINRLRTTISDVDTKLKVLNQLFKSDEATAMQSCDMVVTELENTLREQSPIKTKPNDNGKIVFLRRMSLLQECNIGHVTQEMAACLQLMGGKDVTQGQPIVAKVIKTGEFEIDARKLKATWTYPTGETNITPVEKDNNGNYIVTQNCTSPGVCRLNVTIDDEPIKWSPRKIKVERKGLVNTIEIQLKHGNVSDVVMYEDDCLLISSLTNKLYKYKQSGEYIDTIKLPRDVKVNRMYVMKHGDVAFSDKGKKCISMMQGYKDTMLMYSSQPESGQVMVEKSIGQGTLCDPEGIHVDESSDIVYVADMGRHSCVFMFNIASGQKIKRIWSHRKNTDVTFTKERNLILLNNISNPSQNLFRFFSKSQKIQYKPVLKLFDNGGKFLKDLGIGLDSNLMNSRGVAVDEDGNIIISSEHKLQLFSNKGFFIERLDGEEDEIVNPLGVSIVSYYPRRVAVADKGDNTIKIFNY